MHPTSTSTETVARGLRERAGHARGALAVLALFALLALTLTGGIPQRQPAPSAMAPDEAEARAP